jgi:hypothetical protein
MRTRLIAGVAIVAAASAMTTPALAGKPKPKPINGSYKATATPDPTSTDVASGTYECKPNIPTGKYSYKFTVPAAGSLQVNLANKLDWSVAIRDAQGNTLASEDGGLPNTPESTFASFKRKTAVVIDACNFSGEPTVGVTYTFTYK